MLELRRLTKRYGNLLANDQVDLVIEPGSIHALIGENGAGKSTLAKMICGLVRPDEGEIRLKGQPCVWRSSRDAMKAGIGMVHQHFMLAGSEDALDHVILGNEEVRPWSPIPRSRIKNRLIELAQKNGMPVDWEKKIEDLPIGVQQRVEILKLLDRDFEILILDEPTAVLIPQEVHAFFDRLRELKKRGKTILIVTHKLKEVMELADAVTVLRAGRSVGTVQTSQTRIETLAEMMVGKKMNWGARYSRSSIQADIPKKSMLLEVNHLVDSSKKLRDLSLTVRPGEILGIAGVEGNGQSELLRVLSSPKDYWKSGDIRIFSRNVQKFSARQIRRLGVGVIPEDRLGQGLIPDASLWENFLLGHETAPDFSWKGWIKTERVKSALRKAISDWDIRPGQIDQEVGALSGGNQQKIILAREMHAGPRLILAAQPTRGVDIGAIELIHRRLVDACEAGSGVLLISSEMDEILRLSDRVLVFFQGRITAEFDLRNESITETQLGLAMGGAS